MRRILLLSYFYPPLAGAGVHRVLSFTRHLPAHGWACTVVCAGEDDYWVRDPSLVHAVPPETEVIRAPGGSALATLLRLQRGRGSGERSRGVYAALRAISNWWLLPDSYAGWAGRAARAAARRLAQGGVDAILSSSPPDSAHLAGLSLRRRLRVPWVADFRDPWVGLHYRTPPTAWHRARQSAMERNVLGSADLVLVASRAHEAELRRRSGPPAKPTTGLRLARLEHLPNGFEPGTPEPSLDPGTPDFFTLVFTGTVSLMPDTNVFLEALHDLLARRPEARRRVRAKIVGACESGHVDRAAALGLTGIVEFTGPLPYAAARAVQRGADALLLWKPRGSGYRDAVPGKLYDYLDAGRPLVALLEPDDEAAELVRRAGGDVLPPGQRAPLTEVIERRYLAWKEGHRTPTSRPDWLAEHARGRLAERLARLLDGLVEGDA
jgi:glycosyltransferase involved in cell wall biosynthesis